MIENRKNGEVTLEVSTWEEKLRWVLIHYMITWIGMRWFFLQG